MFLFQYTHGGEQFSHSLRKRIQLVRRIYIAALRERARLHIATYSSAPNQSLARKFSFQTNSEIPAIIRLSTRMFISTIKHVCIRNLL